MLPLTPGSPDLTVAVFGLGYVGLPLCVEIARAGISVIGIDASPGVVEKISLGRPAVEGIDGEALAEATQRLFTVTTDPSEVSRANVVIICVPTPLKDNFLPDLTAVTQVAASISMHLRPGGLVILESTSFPGTTEDIIQPILEDGKRKIDDDFFLAFSPERIDPGNERFNLRNTPKLVGGVSSKSGELATQFYRLFLDSVTELSGSREAEMAKLLENTYRHVNIALANEFARICRELGIDVWEVIRGAATKPFGFQPFYPGPGVGGHCIPIDPQYLASDVRKKLGYGVRFIELAKEINEEMPSYVVQRVQDLLNDHGKALRGQKVLIMGVSYKKDISDTRESPAYKVAAQLLQKGAEVWFNDPMVTEFEVGDRNLPKYGLDQGFSEFDLVLFLQAHSKYHALDFRESDSLIFDATGQISGPIAHKL